jgi:dephospho-CoA kinase
VRRVALIGLHGSGKGTAGRILRAMGYSHWSVGDIRRRLRSGDGCGDLPTLLVAAVRRARPGEPLAPSAVRAILSAADNLPMCAIDGLPDGVEHATHFGSGWRVLNLRCPEPMRQERLRQRAQETDRIWIDGVASPRDARLPMTVAALPPGVVVPIDNDGSLDLLHDRVRAAVRWQDLDAACDGEIGA